MPTFLAGAGIAIPLKCSLVERSPHALDEGD